MQSIFVGKIKIPYADGSENIPSNEITATMATKTFAEF